MSETGRLPRLQVASTRRADEELSGVQSILVDQMKDLSRSQRQHGEKLASLSTTLAAQTDQIRSVANAVEAIRLHISECPARAGWYPLATKVTEIQAANTATTKMLAKANLVPNSPDSGPLSLMPKKRLKGLSPLAERLIYVAAAIGAAAAGYMANAPN
jgi:hypothetical protein